MARILVTEKIAETGLEKLRNAGHEVDVQLDLSPEELVSSVVGAHAIIIRSATTLTKEVFEAADELVVAGRAGVGLDNVDVDAATSAGVMVVNAPQSNILSAAEQTMALILAQARNTPQAAAALKEGRWERSKWNGIELHGKTLGVIGLGRIGKLVAERARAFGMQLVGHDPFVSADAASEIGVELVDLDELAARSDIVTVHVARTPETLGIIGTDFLKKAKDGVRIINVARGGIVDEAALEQGLKSGKVGGAGLDVYDSEPCTDSPLFAHPNVVATPHLGASTREAQDKAGETIAEQVSLALAGDFVPFAVNIDAGEVAGVLKPYVPLAEELGKIFSSLSGDLPSKVTVTFDGEIGGYDNRLVTLSVVKGLLTAVASDAVSFVNADSLLEKHGIEVIAEQAAKGSDYTNLLSVAGGDHSISATLMGLGDEPRIVRIDGYKLDMPPVKNMLIIRNTDAPGVIGRVGTIMGDAGINISNMEVGQAPDSDAAMMVVSIKELVGDQVIESLRGAEGVIEVDLVSL